MGPEIAITLQHNSSNFAKSIGKRPVLRHLLIGMYAIGR
jgi:hypothetical protein